jgi:hypothetical protein
MHELTRSVLLAVVAASDSRVDDVETVAYERLSETQAELTAASFADELDTLLTSGYLTKTRAKRDSAGELVRDRYLVPTTKGRVEVRR